MKEFEDMRIMGIVRLWGYGIVRIASIYIIQCPVFQGCHNYVRLCSTIKLVNLFGLISTHTT